VRGTYHRLDKRKKIVYTLIRNYAELKKIANPIKANLEQSRGAKPKALRDAGQLGCRRFKE
jgi:hypothetical protein